MFGKESRHEAEKAEIENLIQAVKEVSESLTIVSAQAKRTAVELHKLIVRAEAVEKRAMKRGVR